MNEFRKRVEEILPHIRFGDIDFICKLHDRLIEQERTRWTDPCPICKDGIVTKHIGDREYRHVCLACKGSKRTPKQLETLPMSSDHRDIH